MDPIYFSYSIKDHLFSDIPTSVVFDYNLGNTSEKCFLVKPIAEKAHVEIKNGSIWVSQSNLWSEMPILEKELFIRTRNVSTIGANLYFEILDICNGKKTITDKKTIWSENTALGNYVSPKTYISADPPNLEDAKPSNNSQFFVVFTKTIILVVFIFLIILTVVKCKDGKNT